MLRGRRGYLFEFFFNRSDAPANVFEIERSENCTRDYLEIAAVPPAARLLPDAGTSRSHARGTCTTHSFTSRSALLPESKVRSRNVT